MQNPQLAGFIRELTGKIYRTYIHSRLAVAQKELDQESDEGTVNLIVISLSFAETYHHHHHHRFTEPRR